MRLTVILLFCFTANQLPAREYKVQNVKTLLTALNSAQAGDTISVKPGEYDIGRSFSTGNNGTEGKPVTLRCDGERGYAKLMTSGEVGFRIKNRFWIIQGIHVQGSESKTQATVFMDGPGGCGDITMTDCKISGSALHGMKAARTREAGVNNVVLDHVELFNTAFTGFDLVSGNNWLLRNCYVHDYGRKKGISYGIFLKGGGHNGIIESCFVDGKASSTTIGISFGGGLTGKQWLPVVDGKIGPEHFNGTARNNIVVNSTDAAYHSNNASGCKFYNNLAWNCSHFQMQKSYPPDPLLVNNLISGKLRGALKESSHNEVTLEEKWFEDPAKFDFRLSREGVRKLKKKAIDIKECSLDYFYTERNDLFPGPVLPESKLSTAWHDRRK